MARDILTRLVINFVIMIPALSILVYVLPYSATEFNYAMVLILVSIPFIKFLTPSPYKGAVYPLSAIIFLLLVLVTLLTNFTTVFSGTYAQFISLPLHISTFVSAIVALSMILVAEGILSDRIYRTVALLMLSLGGLLDQLAIVTNMVANGTSYFVAYEFINGEEVYSLYTLVVYGYQLVLPLANLKIPIGTFLLGTFVVSIIGILTALYIRGTKDSPETLNRFGYPVFMGSIVGAAAFLIIREVTKYGIQLSVVSISIVVTLFLVGYTSRRTRRLLKD
ncbi:hypothetical protein IX51_07150 [uncultured archaeon]|nr:hypothetical protein IX51_07150 [uncultured archaeon]